MRLYSQRDVRWATHPLGWGPALGTIGAYGCLDSCFAMIVNDAMTAHNPATLDELFTAKKIFVREPTGTYDLLPDRALDLTYPGRFLTVAYAGYRADLINKALPSKHSYAILYISTASVPTHFVIAYSANGVTIADPWTGVVGFLKGYGGPSAVHKTIIVTYIPPAATPPVQPPVAPPVNPTPVVPEPQPLPLPAPAPPQSEGDQLAAALQALVIVILKALKLL